MCKKEKTNHVCIWRQASGTQTCSLVPFNIMLLLSNSLTKRLSYRWLSYSYNNCHNCQLGFHFTLDSCNSPINTCINVACSMSLRFHTALLVKNSRSKNGRPNFSRSLANNNNRKQRIWNFLSVKNLFNFARLLFPIRCFNWEWRSTGSRLFYCPGTLGEFFRRFFPHRLNTLQTPLITSHRLQICSLQ